MLIMCQSIFLMVCLSIPSFYIVVIRSSPASFLASQSLQQPIVDRLFRIGVSIHKDCNFKL